MLTANSQRDDHHSPIFARLNSTENDGWCPKSNSTETSYIQVINVTIQLIK